MHPLTDRDDSVVSWTGYGAALWSLIFAIMHFIWATGWYVGIEPGPPRGEWQEKWFLTYDLTVAGICVFAVPVALAIVRPWGRLIPRWMVGLFAWTGTTLLVLRGVGAMLQTLFFLLTEGHARLHFWDVWFCVGAVLFGLGTWRFWNRSLRDRNLTPA